MTLITLISETMDIEELQRVQARYSHLPVSYVVEAPCYFCSTCVSCKVAVLCTGAD